MLVTAGKTRLIGIMAGKVTDQIYRMKLGTDNTAAALGQTDLVAAVLTQTVATTYGPDPDELTVEAVFTSDGASYKEVGLFSSDGTMLFRQVVTPFAVTTDDQFIVSLVLTLS